MAFFLLRYLRRMGGQVLHRVWNYKVPLREEIRWNICEQGRFSICYWENPNATLRIILFKKIIIVKAECTVFAISFAPLCRYLVALINILIPSVGSVILWLCKRRTRLCNYGLAPRLQSCDSVFGNSWARLGLQRPSVSVQKVLNLFSLLLKLFCVMKKDISNFVIRFWNHGKRSCRSTALELWVGV